MFIKTLILIEESADITLEGTLPLDRGVIAPTSFIFIICPCLASNPYLNLFLQQPEKEFARRSFVLYFALFRTTLDNYFFTLFGRLQFTLAPNHMMFLVIPGFLETKVLITTKHVFRFVVPYSSNEVQIKRAESKLSFSKVKSFIRDRIYEKWNHHYIAYSAGGQCKFLFPNVQNVLSFNQKKFLDFKLLSVA